MRERPPGSTPNDTRVPYTTLFRSGNRILVGFDMAAQEANMRALLRARDIDRPVMSAAFPLRQPVDDAHDAMGVVVRLPVYSSGPRPSEDRKSTRLNSSH